MRDEHYLQIIWLKTLIYISHYEVELIYSFVRHTVLKCDKKKTKV